MIQIKKIEPQIIEHFDFNGNSLGFLNEYENAYLRLCISREKVDGYYLMFEGKKVNIMSTGRFNEDDLVYGIYDTYQTLIFKIHQEYIKNKNNINQ